MVECYNLQNMVDRSASATQLVTAGIPKRNLHRVRGRAVPLPYEALDATATSRA